MTYVLNEAQENWLKALESGEYKQAEGRLIDGCGAMCCLGVGCLVVGMLQEEIEQFDSDESSVAPAAVAKALRLRTRGGRFKNMGIKLKDQYSLSNANDNGATFSEIAAFIRANPTAVFTE